MFSKTHLQPHPWQPERATRVAGPEDLARPVYRKHIDVDVVDFADLRPNAEEMLIAIEDLRGLFSKTCQSAARTTLQLARGVLPRFATPEEIDAAIARTKESKP